MKIITEPASLLLQNPALNRGLNTFTSLISTHDKYIFLEAHIERLIKGADYLFPEFMWGAQAGDIQSLFFDNFKRNHYFRAMIFNDTLVFSKQDHLARPQSCHCSRAFHVKTETLLPSFLKTSAYLIAESELKEARKKGFEDVLFYSKDGILCEATTSNVFIISKDQKIMTPKLSSMTLGGITRLKLMEFLKKNNYHVVETDLTEEDVLNSSEVWLTNAVSGIRYVENYDCNLKSGAFYKEISQLFGRYGENYE